MKWKDVKFWIWVEVIFPTQLFDLEPDFIDTPLFISALTTDRLMGAQGPQGPQDICANDDTGVTVCFDVLSFQSEFELNAIPSAVVNLALGRRADDVTKASNIHFYIDKLQLQLPATVWCLAKTVSGSDSTKLDEWPDGRFKLFEGNITGSNFRRSTTGAEFHLNIIHWLADLNFSSSLSKQSHPLNPAQYFFGAAYNFDLSYTSGVLLTGTIPLMISPQLAMAFFNTDVVTSDFWGGLDSVDIHGKKFLTGLKEWLLLLSKQNRLNFSQIELQLGASNPPTTDLDAAINKDACRALQRFEPDYNGPEFSETGYVLGVPLGFPPDADLNACIARSIGEEIGQEGLAGYTNVTFWDKLASQLKTNYMFSIVPLIDKALVVPFVPGLSSYPTNDLVHRIIRTSQYESIDIQTTIPRPLRGVGVMMEITNEAGAGQTKDRSAAYGSFGGYYDKWAVSNDKRFREGLIMFQQAPRWMSKILSHYVYSRASTGVDGTIQTPVSPTAGSTYSDKEPRLRLQQARPIWDLYARTLYLHEILKNRQGLITGPVRFDIAPGSQIMVEMTEDKYVRQLVNNIPPDDCNDSLSTFNWCSVIRVSTLIDCQNMKAFTTYFVSHLRSETENNDSATSTDRHPLWQKCRWAGCVLVQDDVFEPLTTQVCDE